MVGRLRTVAKLALMERHLFASPPPPADERIPYGSHPLQFGDLRLPGDSPGPHPVVVMIHGGFWRARYSLEHAGHVCAALTAQGIATWSIEYRRIGDPGGAWPGTFHDVGAAVDFVRELASRYNLDLNRVLIMGHSAGGHLAAWAAGRSRIPPDDPLYTADPLRPRSAISLAGVLDLRRAWELRLSNGVTEELMGGTPDEVPERYPTASPIELLPLGVPQVLVHGTSDENVPYEISERYYELARRLGDSVELVTLKGTGHFELVDPKMKEWGRVREAAARLLQ